VVGDGLCVLQRTAVFQVRRDPGAPKGTVTAGGGEKGRLRPPLYHVADVKAAHGLVREPVSLVHAAEKPPLMVATDARSRDVGIQIAIKALGGTALRDA
jgi:hypothetical protein